MDPHVLKIYQVETLTQCRFAVAAFDQLLAAVAKIQSAVQARDMRAAKSASQETFRTIHSFLTHTSNVSKLVWPAAPRRQKNEARSDWKKRCAASPQLQRGLSLRRSLKVPSSVEALRSRKLRDHLEHFDERLDEWEANSKAHNYVQDTVGPPGAIVGIDPQDIMRWYDPGTRKMHFRGETFDLNSLADAAHALESAVLAALPKEFAPYI
jgi:hypothetical protein